MPGISNILYGDRAAAAALKIVLVAERRIPPRIPAKTICLGCTRITCGSASHQVKILSLSERNGKIGDWVFTFLTFIQISLSGAYGERSGHVPARGSTAAKTTPDQKFTVI
jgi:hypothetical protein